MFAAGLAALGTAALGVGRNGDQDFATQLNRLAKEVNGKIDDFQSANRVQFEPGVCALYAHFFLSIPALLECSIRLVAHATLLLIMALGYYIIYCIMCGKSKVEQNSCFDHQFKMYGLYSGLLCGIVSNILFPWSPVLYAFHQNGYIINRPYFEGLNLEMNNTEAMIKHAICFCCCQCCSCVPIMNMPMYKILQTLLYSYGGVYACGSMSACCGECGINGSFQQFLAKAREDASHENSATTTGFYQREYGVSSFEELIQVRLGGGIQQQPPVYSYPPAAAVATPTYAPVAQVTYVQPTPVVRATPIKR